MLRRILIFSAAAAMLRHLHSRRRRCSRSRRWRLSSRWRRLPRRRCRSSRGSRRRLAVRGGRYGYWGGAYRGYGVGAAAVGAAAVGAAAAWAYRSGCGYDAYGNWVCP